MNFGPITVEHSLFVIVFVFAFLLAAACDNDPSVAQKEEARFQEKLTRLNSGELQPKTYSIRLDQLQYDRYAEALFNLGYRMQVIGGEDRDDHYVIIYHPSVSVTVIEGRVK